jgi:hypothetical protein
MLTKQKLEESLGAFKTGKPQFSHDSGLTLSAGINFLANQVGDWLVVAIAKHQQSYDIIYSPELQTYQLWELSTATDTRAVLRCYQDNLADLEPVIEQATDPKGFPLAQLRLFLVEGVLMLPSEYSGP